MSLVDEHRSSIPTGLVRLVPVETGLTNTAGARFTPAPHPDGFEGRGSATLNDDGTASLRIEYPDGRTQRAKLKRQATGKLVPADVDAEQFAGTWRRPDQRIVISKSGGARLAAESSKTANESER